MYIWEKVLFIVMRNEIMIKNFMIMLNSVPFHIPFNGVSMISGLGFGGSVAQLFLHQSGMCRGFGNF